MMRVVIVDDELHAREELACLLGEFGTVEVVAVCADAIEAIKAINRERPDILFLDIQMPVVGGFELLGMVEKSVMPHVVFVTAYDEYALKAFEEKTLDYLLKPVEKDRLDKTLEKLETILGKEEGPAEYGREKISRIPCAVAKRIKLIDPDEVEVVRSDAAGVYLVAAEGEFFTDLTLKVLEEQTLFEHCHRQYLVNLARIDEITLLDGGMAQIRTRSGHSVPVSRRYLKSFKERLGL